MQPKGYTCVNMERVQVKTPQLQGKDIIKESSPVTVRPLIATSVLVACVGAGATAGDLGKFAGIASRSRALTSSACEVKIGRGQEG